MKSVETSKIRILSPLDCELKFNFKGGKNSRGIRVSSYDPEDSNQQPQNISATGQQPQEAPYNSEQAKSGSANQQPPTLGSTRKFSQKVSTISQNYNEKSMLLSSDEEYQ